MFDLLLRKFFGNIFYESIKYALSDLQLLILGNDFHLGKPEKYRFAVVKKENYFAEIIGRFYTLESAMEFCMEHKKNYRIREFSLRIVRINGD